MHRKYHVDALLMLASGKDSELLVVVHIEHLPRPSTFKGEEVMWIEDTFLWMQPIIVFLKDQLLLSNKEEA